VDGGAGQPVRGVGQRDGRDGHGVGGEDRSEAPAVAARAGKRRAQDLGAQRPFPSAMTATPMPTAAPVVAKATASIR
jgi:hypothetical protein